MRGGRQSGESGAGRGSGAGWARRDRPRGGGGRPAPGDALLPQLYNGVDGVGELLVLHTLRGGAQTIAEAIDEEDWPDILGTIAGDDTILLICRSSAARERLTRRLKTLAGEG